MKLYEIILRILNIQGFIIMRITIHNIVPSRPLNSLEHCLCSTSMTNIRTGRDSKPVPLSFKPQLDRIDLEVMWINLKCVCIFISIITLLISLIDTSG